MSESPCSAEECYFSSTETVSSHCHNVNVSASEIEYRDFFSEAWVHLHFTFSTYFILVTSYFILFHPLTILFSCSQWLAIFDSAQLFLHSRLFAYGDRQCRFLITSVIQLLRKLFTTKRTQFLKHLSSQVQEL